MTPRTITRTAALALALTATILTMVAPEARAQNLDEPVATETVLSLPGGGTVSGDTLYLPLDQEVELRISARDQHGREFPQQRLRFEFTMDRNCHGLVELTGADDHGITLRTGKGAGSCDVLLWLPNNLNADRRLRIVGNRGAGGSGAGGSGGVVTAPATGPIDTREELIAASLFRAVLGREPDAEWVAAASAEIRRNRLRDQIQGLLGSDEFRQRRDAREANDILRDFYRGLLGRDPDTSGMRRYLDNIQRGEYEPVIREILDSDEFDERVDRELG